MRSGYKDLIPLHRFENGGVSNFESILYFYRRLAEKVYAWAAVLVFLTCGCISRTQTNAGRLAIITIFVENATLTPEEMRTALQLAAKAGLKQPAEVQTFHYIPSTVVGIKIQGVNHRKGRLTNYEEAILSCSKFAALPAQVGALRLGDFWVNSPYVRTNHLLNVTLSGKKKDIWISEYLSEEIADKIIERLITGNVIFASTDDQEIATDFRSVNISNLYSLNYDRTAGEYEILVGKGNIVQVIHCKLVKGQVLILSLFNPIF